MRELRIGGLTPLTTIDFPGRLAAVVFCQGCPCRCSYCHNPHLWGADSETEAAWQDVVNFLARRRGLLDGVVFSGGEPTLQPALPGAMRQVRALGFQLALHTAGIYPDRLAAVLPLLDWVGLDIKAPLQHYDTVTQVRASGKRVSKSLDLVLRSGVDYECRTTWHPGLFPESELWALGQVLAARGVTCWTVQACRIEGEPVAELTRLDPGRLHGRIADLALRGGHPACAVLPKRLDGTRGSVRRTRRLHRHPSQ